MELQKIAEELIANQKKKPLAYDVFSMAKSFNEAKQINEKNGLIPPAIMNLAFSVELLLKSFILSERLDIYSSNDFESPKQANKVYGGHRIYELFDKINSNNKQKILDVLGSKIGKSLDSSSFNMLLVENNCEDPFVDWRYIFENEEVITINYDFLSTFCDALGDLLAKELTEKSM